MDTNLEMAHFFDRLAENWDNSPADFAVRERIVQLAQIKPNAVIADIGCGKGVFFPHLLAQNPAHIYAVELSQQMILGAQALFGTDNITYLNQDVLSAELPMLDVAVIYNAYPHFLNKQALAQKLAQHVKPGGIALIAHGTGKNGINNHHGGNSVVKLSVPLRNASVEAAEFAPYFMPQELIDQEDLYFIKLVRQ